MMSKPANGRYVLIAARAVGAAAMCLVALPGVATPIVAGADTVGGVRPDAVILHVDTLADAGPGSLRAAVETERPRVIVFDVAGPIRLAKDLVVREPHVTIAGQTAPWPGVTLTGASLRIRTHDVVLRHIAVRPGAAASREENDNRDAISIDGSGKRGRGRDASQNILVENVSLSWSADEILSLWYRTTGRVSIVNSIFAEALDEAGHPKGAHSMGVLVGPRIERVEISGNLFASNRFRNPVVVEGASAYIANNFVFNPGHNAIHFYKRKNTETTAASIISNSVAPGPDTSKTMAAVSIPKNADRALMDLFIDGNESLLVRGDAGMVARQDAWSRQMPVTSRFHAPRAAGEVRDWAFTNAGMFPARRNPVDAALIERIRAGTEAVIDAPLPSDLQLLNESAAAPAKPPAEPFEADPATGNLRIADWLCAKHLQWGGTDCRGIGSH